VAGEGRRRRGAVAKLRRAIMCGGGRETEGKKAGDDDHLHAELLRWEGVTERRWSGMTVVCQSLVVKAATRARFCEAKGGGCSSGGF
jgi:hypothetical protein